MVAQASDKLSVSDSDHAKALGFLYARCGDIMTLPGLPARPAGERIDIEHDGTIRRLF
ncbi:MAG: formate--tetrahydrofolate ligase [Coriobacteriia bacterium]|nr:formate--tetrahydrofolate ligase [Coriobacteriia bacterium]